MKFHINAPLQFGGAANEQDIIDAAINSNGLIYSKWTLDAAMERLDGNIPENLKQKFIDNNNLLVEIGNESEGSEFFNLEDADSELEAAKEAIARDLYDCHFLDIEEAKEFLTSYNGHQAIKAKALVKELIENLQ